MRATYRSMYIGPPTDLPPGEASALLQNCSTILRDKLLNMVKMSVGHTADLFQFSTSVSEIDARSFMNRRGEWLEAFDATMADILERRLRGELRRGRRVDADVSFDPDEPNENLQFLSPEDLAQQTALARSCRILTHVTKKELIALDLRVAAVAAPVYNFDIGNPFGVDEIMDAIGATSRTVYPMPPVWRSLMDRVVSDLLWSINNLYVALNQVLADRGVLPQIKAVLRARSPRRPKDDRELLPVFIKLMETAGLSAPNDVMVPEAGNDSSLPSIIFTDGVKPAAVSSPQPEDVPAAPAPPADKRANAKIVEELAALGKRTSAGTPLAAASPDDFPEVDQSMTLGASAELYSSLNELQRVDLATAVRNLFPDALRDEPSALPLNLIPHIRAANADRIANPADRITMDVVGLLFDYIFRDPSIPGAMRMLFGRLQVPVVKAALLDRRFFSDKDHPARQVLDHLSEAAVGAGDANEYGHAFHEVSTRVIDDICRDFAIDVSVFERANEKLVEFMAMERQILQETLARHIAEAEAAEVRDVDRAEVRVTIRERLAGLNVPFNVHSFVETTWAGYLVQLRLDEGETSATYREALETIDKLLWSLVAKERQAQKSRLAKMIPGLIGALRRGMVAMGVTAEAASPFLQEMYDLHVAAIRPRPPIYVPDDLSLPAVGTEARTVSVHDFVDEVPMGTWISFTVDGRSVPAQLAWTSTKRGRFIFTRHSPARVLSFTAEELAYELGTGRASVIVEAVPLFDRAVSVALDELAAKAGPAAVVKATKSTLRSLGLNQVYTR